MEIVTNRFLLREFVDSDIPDFEEYHNDPRSLEFYGAEEAKPGHARELIALFQAWAAEQPRLNYQLAIIQRKTPQALVGCCGLRSAGSEPGTAELGIELASDYWGRFGYATEVMRSLVQFGFGSLGLQTIYGGIVSANSRIARLGQRQLIVRLQLGCPPKVGLKLNGRLTREQWDGERSGT